MAVETSVSRVIMRISDNQGYAPDQINTRFTLADLLEEVTDAIDEFGGEATIVLNNGQRYGASYGSILDPGFGGLFANVDDDEEEEF